MFQKRIHATWAISEKFLEKEICVRCLSILKHFTTLSENINSYIWHHTDVLKVPEMNTYNLNYFRLAKTSMQHTHLKLWVQVYEDLYKLYRSYEDLNKLNFDSVFTSVFQH